MKISKLQPPRKQTPTPPRKEQFLMTSSPQEPKAVDEYTPSQNGGEALVGTLSGIVIGCSIGALISAGDRWPVVTMGIVGGLTGLSLGMLASPASGNVRLR